MPTIEKLLSTERLNKYGLTNPVDSRLYHAYNIELSETFYPSITYFEIVLRNKVDSIFSKYFGANWVLDSSLLNLKSFEYVQKAQRQLQRDKKNSMDKNFIISELTFGFWTSLFMESYRPTIWDKYPNILLEIFNKAKKPKLSEKRAVLNHIRNHRNKVFHASSIIHPSLKINPQQMHNLIYTNLRALDAQAIVKIVNNIDRFNAVYQKGISLGTIKVKKI